jgi:hypothetical protein
MKKGLITCVLSLFVFQGLFTNTSAEISSTVRESHAGASATSIGQFNEKLNEVVPSAEQFFNNVNSALTVFNAQIDGSGIIKLIEDEVQKIKTAIDTTSGEDCDKALRGGVFTLKQIVLREVDMKLECGYEVPSPTNACIPINTFNENYFPVLRKPMDDLEKILNHDSDFDLITDICEELTSGPSPSGSSSSGGIGNSSSSGGPISNPSIDNFNNALDNFLEAIGNLIDLTGKRVFIIDLDLVKSITGPMRIAPTYKHGKCVSETEHGIKLLRAILRKIRIMVCTSNEVKRGSSNCLKKSEFDELFPAINSAFVAVKSASRADNNKNGKQDICEGSH